MPSRRRARLSADPETVLIAALSGRALAAAARRAGYRPLVADLFRDADTRRLATRSALIPSTLREGITGPELAESLGRLRKPGEAPPAGLVYGAGFEDRPALLARLAETVPILGNDATAIQRIKDPTSFFSRLGDLGIPHPEVRFSPPGQARGWLRKRRGASGGHHVRRARPDEAPEPGVYYQRRVAGQAVSALFLADGTRTTTIGFSLQWGSGGRGHAFRFGGAAGPAALSPALAEDMETAVRRIALAFGLRGLNSADFMVRGGSFDLLEVNPRPGATLDIFDRLSDAPLFALHCAACRGVLPDHAPIPKGAAACAVVYARRAVTIPDSWRWPRWCLDRAEAETRIGRSEPVCTVLARAPTAEAARRRVIERERSLHERLRPSGPRPIAAGKTTNAALTL